MNYYTKIPKDGSHSAQQAFDINNKNIGHNPIKKNKISGGWKTMDELEKLQNLSETIKSTKIYKAITPH